MHLFARFVHLQVKAAEVEAAIAANLGEFGYGGQEADHEELSRVR